MVAEQREAGLDRAAKESAVRGGEPVRQAGAGRLGRRSMVHSASVDRYVPSLVSAVTLVGDTQRAWTGVQSSGPTKDGSMASSERHSRPWVKSMVQWASRVASWTRPAPRTLTGPLSPVMQVGSRAASGRWALSSSLAVSGSRSIITVLPVVTADAAAMTRTSVVSAPEPRPTCAGCATPASRGASP